MITFHDARAEWLWGSILLNLILSSVPHMVAIRVCCIPYISNPVELKLQRYRVLHDSEWSRFCSR